MFCIKCGTEIPDDSSFCPECGRSVAQATASGGGASQPPPAPAPPQFPRAIAPAARATDGFRVAIAVGSIVGAALIFIGTFLPWVSTAQYFGTEFTANGFDGGYVTDPDDGENGVDGILTLVISLAAGGLAAHYLHRRSVWSSLGILALGTAASGVGGYNIGKIIYEFSEALGVSRNDALDYVGEGLYAVIAGGVVMAITALVGLAGAQPSQGGRGR